MTEAEFWNLFAAAERQADDAVTYAHDGPRILQKLLEPLPPEEIESFAVIFNRKYLAAYDWDLWGAAYVIGGGCGDDGFMDFRSELISRGEQIYEAALRDPESLADVEPAVIGAEGWQYVAWRAYLAKTGRDLPDNRELQAGDPVGRHWKEEELPTRFPRLSAKFEFE